jgi:cyclic pyranopterin phosphate synthase
MTDSPEMQLIDQCNRHLNYLRISITDRCNLNCIYCRPSERISRLSHHDILSYEEILRIVRIGIRLGINKVRVTGGEPLVRKGVDHFLKQLNDLAGLQEVTLTTNGVSLAKHLEKIWSAGVRRINISLDTLDRDKFSQITGSDQFEQVWSAIDSAHKMGFKPLKLNIVALRRINADELTDFARLSIEKPYHVRFIEYMPIGKTRSNSGPPLLVPEIKTTIEKIGRLLPVERSVKDGPAQRFRFEGALGEIGFISAMSHHFCGTCNRLRLTADGHLRPCLLSDRQIDIKRVIRSDCSDSEIADLFLQAVKHKPANHHICIGDQAGVACQMSSIGG